MNNKLFLVCPFACMENFIQEIYGFDTIFITEMAAIFNFNSLGISAIKIAIEREKIQEIIIASDTSCRFINAALNHEKKFGSYAEKVIENIVLENSEMLAKSNSKMEKQKIIANAIIENQAKELSSHNLFLSEIVKNKITIRGIITTKSNNEIIELNLNTY